MKNMVIKVIPRLLLITVLAFTSCSTLVDKKVNQIPNIILIMTDDQGWLDVGFNGNDEIRTPNLDMIASEGVIFNRFYSASAVCSPTRASVLTGRNPLRTDIPYANDGHLKKEEITISEILKPQGYNTGHFGKWHLGTLTKSHLDANRGGRSEFDEDYSIPTEHGYDQFFCTESKVPTYDPLIYPTEFSETEGKRFGWRAIEKGEASNDYGTAYWVGENQKETDNLEGDNSRIIMDRVIPFIKESVEEDKPFFSTIWLHTPHLPVVSDSTHRSYFPGLELDKQIYYGTISAMDEQIGRLWKMLNERGIEEETIIFFCSDNGPERATPGSAGVFRDRKRSLYEGGVRVPAFVTWKGQLKGDRRIDYPSVTSDYLPTILDVLDLEYPDNRPIDGISLLESIKGSTTERIKPIGFICTPHISWVTHQYKLIGDQDLKSFELYDILNDQTEKTNIIDDFPEEAEIMKADLLGWMSSVEDSKKEMDYSQK